MTSGTRHSGLLLLAVVTLLTALLWLLSVKHFKIDDAPTIQHLLPETVLQQARYSEALLPSAGIPVTVAFNDNISTEIIHQFEQALQAQASISSVWCLHRQEVAEKPDQWELCSDDINNRKNTLLLFYAAIDQLSLENSRQFVNAINTLIKLHFPDTGKNTITAYSQAHMRVASWRAADATLVNIAWLLMIIVIAIPAITYKSVIASLFLLLNAAVTTSITLLISTNLNMLMLLVIPSVWAIATLDASHLLERTLHAASAGHKKPVRDAIKSLLPPCSITTASTAVGFSALAFQNSSPLLSDIGKLAAAGTLIAFVVTFTMGSLILSWVMQNRQMQQPEKRIYQFLLEIHCFSQRNPRRVILIWCAILLLAVVSGMSVKQSVSFPHIFANASKQSATLQTLAGISGTTLNPMSITLEATDEHGKQSRQLYSSIAAVSDYLYKLPETAYLLPLAISQIHKTQDFSPTDNNSAQAAPSKYWLSTEQGIARIDVHFSTMSSERFHQIEQWIRHFDETMLGHYRLHLTGPGYQYHLSEKLGFEGMIEGFLYAAAGILLLLGFTLHRSVILVMLITTSLPFVFIFGLMGLLNIDWTLGLLPIPLVLLGLVVDDAIYLLWKKQKREQSSLSRNIQHSGIALLTTTLLLSCCLLSLYLSDLLVNQQLAILLSAGISIALLVDLTLIPALFNLRTRRSIPVQL